MYMVYRLSMVREEVERGDNIIGIYARKGGAIVKLETLAHNNPGITYGIAILPEGAQPRFNAIKSVYAVMSVSKAEAIIAANAESRPFSNPSDSDIPFLGE